MFYRIKNEKMYDYADYEYSKNCLFTAFCTKDEYERNRDNYVIKDGKLEVIADMAESFAARQKTEFEKEFFNTSLGWIRRKVTMADGSVKDFLSDLLIPIKAGMDLGQSVEIITYRTPDFTRLITNEYMENLQEKKVPDFGFVIECLERIVSDFSSGEVQYGIYD